MFLTFMVAQMGEDKTNKQTNKQQQKILEVVAQVNLELKKKSGITSSKETLFRNADYRRNKSVMLK